MDIVGLLNSISFKGILGPLFGAWFGAKMAFRYDKSLKDEEIISKEVEIAKYVQFILRTHIHVVDNTWNQYLSVEKDDLKWRHLKLKRFDFIDSPSLNFEKLSFMGDRINSNMLYTLFIHEREFKNFVDSLNTRSKFYNDNIKSLQSDKSNEIIIKDLTDIIYASYERIKKSNEVFFPKFRKYLMVRYPDVEFLEITNARDSD